MTNMTLIYAGGNSIIRNINDKTDSYATVKPQSLLAAFLRQFNFFSCMASTNPILKLLKRVSNVPVQFHEIFPKDVVRFLSSKATFLNSSIGYLAPALLATTAFLSARNGYTVEALTHEQPLNLYTIFVGYPGTGKSSALQHGCLEPIAAGKRIDARQNSIIRSGKTSCDEK